VNPIEWLHDRYIAARRLRVLAGHLAELIPADASLLDVGCGDGRLAAGIQRRRGGGRVTGLDVQVRPDASIPVAHYDGRTLPHPDASFDTVLFADVLHHSEDPRKLLAEGVRVARRSVLIKDHLLRGPVSARLLRFMDDVGNSRFGVALPYNYWPEERWLETFRTLELTLDAWVPRLGLYPGPLDWLFGGALHFVASLGVPGRHQRR
jgi:SAM-dependent methyltransferase